MLNSFEIALSNVLRHNPDADIVAAVEMASARIEERDDEVDEIAWH